MSNERDRAPKGGRAWIAGVVLILGTTVAANFYVMHLAGDDPSFAIEPDYYDRALHWDDELAQRERNAQLGWRASPALDAAAAQGTTVQVRLADAAGVPVRDATVRVSAFPIARSAQVAEATLSPRADGAYAAPFPVQRSGAWEVRIEAVRGGDRFTSVHRLDVPAAGVQAR